MECLTILAKILIKKKILFASTQSSFQILPACDESIWKLTQWAREIHEMCLSLGMVPN